MPSKSIHVAANGKTSFFFKCLSSIPFIFFNHSSVDEHLGCFHILTIINNIAVNTGVHVISS